VPLNGRIVFAGALILLAGTREQIVQITVIANVSSIAFAFAHNFHVSLVWLIVALLDRE
jgi:hypothetical protein